MIQKLLKMLESLIPRRAYAPVGKPLQQQSGNNVRRERPRC
jgi:hypothetical protein